MSAMDAALEKDIIGLVAAAAAYDPAVLKQMYAKQFANVKVHASTTEAPNTTNATQESMPVIGVAGTIQDGEAFNLS